MGKVIDKETGKVLATFEDELEGEKLKLKYKAEGKSLKMEW
jgi:hypothetical protein